VGSPCCLQSPRRASLGSSPRSHPLPRRECSAGWSRLPPGKARGARTVRPPAERCSALPCTHHDAALEGKPAAVGRELGLMHELQRRDRHLRLAMEVTSASLRPSRVYMCVCVCARARV
jgi:hypothetical protein